MAKVVQQDDLDMVLNTHRSWCDFGNYESIGKQQAADGKCLATHHPLLKATLNLQPSGQFLLVQVRSALLKICAMEPEVNQSNLKNILWAH